MSALLPRTPSRSLLVAIGLPALLATVASLLVRTEWASLVAPLLGPWAGLPYGHRDCTLANQASLWSWSATAALLLTVPIAWRSRAWPRASPRRVAVLALGLAAFQWFAIAWLSVVNTTS